MTAVRQRRDRSMPAGAPSPPARRRAGSGGTGGLAGARMKCARMRTIPRPSFGDATGPAPPVAETATSIRPSRLVALPPGACLAGLSLASGHPGSESDRACGRITRVAEGHPTAILSSPLPTCCHRHLNALPSRPSFWAKPERGMGKGESKKNRITSHHTNQRHFISP